MNPMFLQIHSSPHLTCTCPKKTIAKKIIATTQKKKKRKRKMTLREKALNDDHAIVQKNT